MQTVDIEVCTRAMALGITPGEQMLDTVCGSMISQ